MELHPNLHMSIMRKTRQEILYGTEKNTLKKTSYCIIPVQSHFLASEGIPDVLDMVRSVQKHFNQNLKIAGILLTMYQSRPQLCKSPRGLRRRFTRLWPPYRVHHPYCGMPHGRHEYSGLRAGQPGSGILSESRLGGAAAWLERT